MPRKVRGQVDIEARLKKIANGDSSKIPKVASKLLHEYQKKLSEQQKISVMQDLLMFNLLVEVEKFATVLPYIFNKTIELKILLGDKSIDHINKYEKDIVSYLQTNIQRIRTIISFCKENDPYDNLTIQQIQQLLHQPLLEGTIPEGQNND